MVQDHLVFDFNSESDMNNWIIVDDGVMGGVSTGQIKITEEGHCRYFGDISLENYGGFSSLRYTFPAKKINDFQYVKLTIKGDGKNFQFRLKESKSHYYSYIYQFSTSGEWEEVLIPLSELYPTFRGRKLDLDNFSANTMEQVGFLRGNKRAESFELLIDKIELE